MFDHTLSRLFDYPLPTPQNTLYHKLGISPEATAVEIREAKREASNRLIAQQAELNKELSQVYEKIPELKAAYDTIKTLRDQGHNPNPEELAKAEKNLGSLERKAEEAKPGFKQLRDRAVELEQKIYEINRIQLDNPEERLEYDKSTPPCALFKIENCDQEVFSDSKTALFLLRVELSQFLEKHGETCYHPSDLTREDFHSDFTYNDILDGARHGKRRTQR